MNIPKKLDTIWGIFLSKKDISKSCFIKKLSISSSLSAYFNQKEN
jgi:hypothetical protein